MVMSNYPTGFADGLTIRGMPLQVAHPGKVFWVNNSGVLAPNGIGASDGNPGTYQKPFSTIDYAIGKCTAGRGDIIMVMPGHAETITTAGAISLDVSGVAIVGLGTGALMPTISFGATAATLAMSGANTALINIRLLATIDSVVAGVLISAAGCTLDIETADTSSTVEFISPIVTTAAADNLKIRARHMGFSGDAMTRYIDLVGVNDAEIDVNFFGTASVAVVNMRTTACTNIRITGNFYNGTGALAYNVVASVGSSWNVSGFEGLAGRPFYGSGLIPVAYAGSTTSLTAGTSNTQAISIASSAKTLAAGDTTMFIISGGPIKILELVGIVTTVVQTQTTSVKITATTTSPAATVDFSAAAVDITGATAGSSIRHINTTGILTVVAAGFVMEGNAFATNDTQYLMPAGTLKINNASAANTGAITWYMRYVPLSTAVTVV